MKSLLFLILFYFISNIYGQVNTNYILLDEANKAIDSITYKKKCNSLLYDCQMIKTDSLIVLTMTQNYEFGKLNSLENTQVRNLLYRATKQKYNPNKTLIIYLKDTIVGFEYHLKKRVNYKVNYRNFVDSTYYGNNTYYGIKAYDDMYEFENKFRRRYDKNQKECKKKYEKYNVEAVYFYYRNFDYTYQPKNFTFHKIPTSLKRFLFKKNNTGYVILKPNGNYFYYGSMKENKLKELLKNNWKPFIDEYNSIKENLPEKLKKGFFKGIEYKYTSNYHCYCRTLSGY